MTEREYRNHPSVSRSMLWHIMESPEKFQYYLHNPKESTPALIFGQLFHKLVLQPETFLEDFAICPNADRRTKYGKEIYREFITASEGRIVVTMDEVEKAQEMCNALKSNAFAMKLLDGEKEKPFFWTDNLTGEGCKCRTDVILEVGELPLVVDLKTVTNADTESFTREAIRLGYDFQAAMYLEGVKAVTGKDCSFVFIVIEKDPPYAINILQADKLFVRRGYDIFRELIGVYHECKKTGLWWGYLGRYNQINNLALPSFLAKEVE